MAEVKGLMAVKSDKTADILWGGLDGTDTGEAVEARAFPEKTLMVTGTFGSTTSTLTMQGSNDENNWFTLTDDFGNDLSMTSADMKNIRQNPTWIRPSLSSTAATSCVNVHIAAV